MIRIIATVSFLLILAMSTGWAGDGGTVSPFSMGAGARDLALGGAAVTSADPATSVYWNPSALADAQRFSLGAFHCRLYDSDVSYQYVGAVVPTLDFGSFGMGVFRIGVGGIEKRDNNNLHLGDVEDIRLAFHLGYARQISGYTIGLSASLEHHSLDNYSSTSSPGMGLSIGRRLPTRLDWLPEIAVTAIGRNLVRQSIKLAEESVSHPYSVDAGISVKLLPRPKSNHVITLFGRMTKIDFLDPKLSAGLEYSLHDLLSLRGAVRDKKLSFGAGLAYRSLIFDYAVVDRDLGLLHMFSITSSFGKPVSVRRKLREEQREARFNRLLSDQLTARNSKTIAQLVGHGEDHLAAGEAREAGILFDRALFLSRSNGLDTTAVYKLSSETNDQLYRETRQRTYRENIDSATARLEVQDYLSASYFASLALEVEPNSQEAQSILANANAEMERSATVQQAIEQQLLVSDSLLSYGKYDEALAALKSLSSIAGSDSRIQMAMKKAEFERWREIAKTYFAGSDYLSAGKAIDSASIRFPDHPGCMELKKKIDRATSRREMPAAKQEIRIAEPLSEQLTGEVKKDYRAGQKSFEKGDLQAALQRWERVERIAPDYMSVREYLVSAYKFVGIEHYGKGQLKEAIAAWKRAVELVPDNSEIANYIRRTESEILKLQEFTYEHQ